MILSLWGRHLTDALTNQLLSWGELLLPVFLAGLLLRASPRTVSLGIAAICAVLAFRLFAISLPPDTHPLTGAVLPVEELWPSVLCYVVAVVALLLTARSPLPPARKGAALWATAVVASRTRHRIALGLGALLVIATVLPGRTPSAEPGEPHPS
ncbi:hypothetical protein [Streptosporangium sp. NPDC051022]|uniref:hypothetical protein n=1 Tax=Streptosporangium sp. NPDC051022 TaxID=3155752 RepID=UPI003448AAA4